MAIDGLDLVREALFEMLIISLPILAAGLLVGLIISLFQAVTQIQEQTLTFVPKIIVMIIVAVALIGWIGQRMLEFAATMFAGL